MVKNEKSRIGIRTGGQHGFGPVAHPTRKPRPITEDTACIGRRTVARIWSLVRSISPYRYTYYLKAAHLAYRISSNLYGSNGPLAVEMEHPRLCYWALEVKALKYMGPKKNTFPGVRKLIRRAI
jgi:hypothetical protein